jgi:hypothetical protein
MAECPKLPLETLAAIERAREHIYQHAQVTWDMLFRPISPVAPGALLFSGKPTPAILTLQFREYSQTLFNAEAPHYCDQAKNEADLHKCLMEVAERIASEVSNEMWRDDSHSFHCSRADCEGAIRGGLVDRLKYWMAEYRKLAASKHRVPEDPIEPVSGRTAWNILERSRATNAHLQETMARAKEVLEGSDAPTQEQVMSIPPSPPRNAPAIEKLRFSRRASWLEDRLRERAWNRNHPSKFGGPDPKTIDKILAGGEVREDVLEKLASALSKKRGKIEITTIPGD